MLCTGDMSPLSLPALVVLVVVAWSNCGCCCVQMALFSLGFSLSTSHLFLGLSGLLLALIWGGATVGILRTFFEKWPVSAVPVPEI